MIGYVKQPLLDAIEDALNILGRPSGEWEDRSYAEREQKDERTAGYRYEIDEAIYTLRAALGRPVPTRKCTVCWAKNSIYWQKGDPTDKMSCHECGTIEPESVVVNEKAPDLAD